MLRETRGSLVASGASDGGASFEATAAIALPSACRAVPPSWKTNTADEPMDLLEKLKGFALAFVSGRALPPAPLTEDGLTAPAAWHPSRPILATVDGEGQVLIHHDPARRFLLSSPRPEDANDAADSPPPTAALRHALHARARALAWRPCAGATLAVAGGDGVCLWSRDPGAAGVPVARVADAARGAPRQAAAKPQQWRVRRLLDDCDDAPSGAAEDPFRAAGLGASSARLVAFAAAAARETARRLGPTAKKYARELSGAKADFQTTSHPSGPGKTPHSYDTVDWSPDGVLLAAASKDFSAISVWEICTGKRVKVASHAKGVTFVKFSRCGGYLFAAHERSGFTVWETETWRASFWRTDDVPVTAAAWGPAPPGAGSLGEGSVPGAGDGATLLVATRGCSSRLGAVHFSFPARDLRATVLPVDLPRAVTRGAGEPSGVSSPHETTASSPDIVDMSWDPSGRRLAVAFEADRALGIGREASGGDSDASRVVSKEEHGKVGVFTTRVSPVVRASLVGYVSGSNHGFGRSGEDGGTPFPSGGPARAVDFSGPGGAAGCRDLREGDATEAMTTLAVCWEGGGVSFVPVFA
jgi:aladin